MVAKYMYEISKHSTGVGKAHLVEMGHRLRAAQGGSFRCAFCLSEEPDLLSQWRGYTPNGGYAIGFRTEVLEAVAGRHGLQLSPCLYREKDQFGALAPALAPVMASYSHWEINEAEWQRRFNQISQASEPVRSVVKHPSFAEEREWRIHGSVQATDPRSKWRPSGEYIRPYVEIALHEDGGRDTGRAVSEIWIGPGGDALRANAALTHMIIGLRLEMPTIRFSESPLRR